MRSGRSDERAREGGGGVIADWKNGAWRIRVGNHNWNPNSLGIYIQRRNGQEVEILTSKPSIERWEPGSYTEATLQLDLDRAQQLMDDLWTAGVRPTEGHGSSGQRAALESHLADMRSLVSHFTKAKLP